MKSVQIPLPWQLPRRHYTVSELSDAVRDALGEFTDIWVSGEISGTKTGSSGHIYFILKDETAQLRCVCFARSARFLRFKPRDGVAVIARGRLDVYAARGEYQLLVEALEPRGHGALQLALEELKKKLAAEGLFDAARKRPIPAYPRRIGIVTSPTGAVIRDLIDILTRRFPGLHIRLYPSQVQGEGAVEQVCRAIEYFSRSQWADVVIVARGGGSLEDLWTFNEEPVARAIAACSVPVISAVGHETDFTIADFVADLRAATPSAAAELVVGTRRQLLERLDNAAVRLNQAIRYRLAIARKRWHELSPGPAGAALQRLIGKRLQTADEWDARMREAVRRLIVERRGRLADLDARLRRQDVRLRLAQGRSRLDLLSARLRERMRWIVAGSRARHHTLAVKLEQLSPLRILLRGYAIVQAPDGSVVKTARQVSHGDHLSVRLAEGSLQVMVEDSSATAGRSSSPGQGPPSS